MWWGNRSKLENRQQWCFGSTDMAAIPTLVAWSPLGTINNWFCLATADGSRGVAPHFSTISVVWPNQRDRVREKPSNWMETLLNGHSDQHDLFSIYVTAMAPCIMVDIILYEPQWATLHCRDASFRQASEVHLSFYIFNQTCIHNSRKVSVRWINLVHELLWKWYKIFF